MQTLVAKYHGLLSNQLCSAVGCKSSNAALKVEWVIVPAAGKQNILYAIDHYHTRSSQPGIIAYLCRRCLAEHCLPQGYVVRGTLVCPRSVRWSSFGGN